MMKKVFLLLLFAALPLQAQRVELDSSSQPSGNVGTDYRPVDEQGQAAPFTIQAKTNINWWDYSNPNAGGSLGSLYFSSKGLGVRNSSGWGSYDLSKGEELLFSFDEPVLVNGFKMGVVDLNFDYGYYSYPDKPIFFLDIAGDEPFTLTLDDAALKNLYTSIGSNTGYFDFTGLVQSLGLPEDASMSSLKVRETSDEFYVSYVESSPNVEVPEPGIYLILIGGLAIACAAYFLRKRRVR